MSLLAIFGSFQASFWYSALVTHPQISYNTLTMPRGERPPIHEMEPSSFLSLEHWIEHDFQRQYEILAKIMAKTGDLELLPDVGEMGILGMDGREYPIPSMEGLVREMTKTPERKERIETKMKQGFTNLDLTPFASPIERLMATTERVIRKHHADGKLFATRKNPSDGNEPLMPLELDTTKPLFVWDKLIHADVNGELQYFVKQFDKTNHGGKTKQQLLDEAIRTGAPFPGWDVSLQESSINIPRQGKGQTIGGRKQLETSQTPTEYLRTLLTDPNYRDESGTTIEQWLTKLKNTLERTHQVIDDYSGSGSLNYLIAQYHPASGYVPRGCWFRGSRQAYVDRDDPEIRDDYDGVRPAVRFSRLGV